MPDYEALSDMATKMANQIAEKASSFGLEVETKKGNNGSLSYSGSQEQFDKFWDSLKSKTKK